MTLVPKVENTRTSVAEKMASSSESDEDIIPRPLRVKALQDSFPTQLKIPQRSSSVYFPHSVNSTKHIAAGLDLKLPSLVPSPANSPSLTVAKSRRCGASSIRSYDDILYARRRQCPTLSPPHFPEVSSSDEQSLLGKYRSHLECTGKDEADRDRIWSRTSSSSSTPNEGSPEISSTAGAVHHVPQHCSSAQRQYSVRADNMDDPGLCGSALDGKVMSRTSRLRAYKQRFLHKVGVGFRIGSTGEEGLVDWNKQINQDLGANNCYSERINNFDKMSSSKSDETTGSTKTAFFGYPSPLSTPPRSSFTASTVATSTEDAPKSRSIVAPRRTSCPVLAAKLVLTPERKRVAIDCENDMFVAIDVEAVMESDCPTHLRVAEPALLVAAIVDNSVLTSPASLITSCEAVSYIASQLQNPRDRLAVLATHGCDAEPGPQIILPMECISARQMKAISDSIMLSSKAIESSILETISVAARLFLNEPSNEVNEGHISISLRHVIVFTTDSSAISLGLRQMDKSVTLHFVNPGIVPWKQPAAPSTNGWKITNDLSSPLSTENFDQFDLQRKLGNMLADMRQYHDHGRLTNVVLKIRAGYKCRLQGVMGETSFLQLYPGETRTCLVKVQPGFLPDQRNRLLQFPCGPRTASGAIDIEKELEHIIGNEGRIILSVTVEYEHSLFPEGTICSCQSDARISEYVQVSEGCGQYASSEATLTAATSTYNTYVQRCIVSHLASCHSPRQALTTLASHFGSDTNQSMCPAFLESVVKELRHRAGIQDCQSGVSDDEITIDPRDDGSDKNNQQNIASGTIVPPLRSTSSDLTGLIGHTLSVSSTASISTAKGKKENDMARKIWLELRRNSRSAHNTQTSTNSPGEGLKITGRFLADEWKRLQSIAVKNKRSLGQDTLRSLSYAGTKTRNSAPWL